MYDFLLFVGLLFFLPKVLYDRVVKGKYKHGWKERLGIKRPLFSLDTSKKRLWIHAVSVGETKAAAVLLQEIKQQEIEIVFSTTTLTGLEEAKRTLPGVAATFLLPLDFSWNMRYLAKKIAPSALILVESDFWYNLLRVVPTAILINGKLSEQSFRRFKKFPFFTRRLFKNISLFCVQTAEYAARFEALGVEKKKIHVTGNLKLASAPPPFPPTILKEWRDHLGLTEKDTVITLGSTHEGEEKELLDALLPLFPAFPLLKVVVVPRHPERFERVRSLLKNYPSERVILVDQMGKLTLCYAISSLAIVAGSFSSGIGGHNILEPVWFQVPVLFGPAMHQQRELVKIVEEAKAGEQVTSGSLASSVQKWLKISRQQTTHLSDKNRESILLTWNKIRSELNI